MALAVVWSRAQAGIESPLVAVEADLLPGLPSMTLVGLPEAAVRESRERVRSALINSGFDFPAGRITLSLAPADLPKTGSRFDLPIALGILAASGQIPREPLDQFEFAGELALSGALRPFPGALAMMLGAWPDGRTLILPQAVEQEAAALAEMDVRVASSLLDVCAFLKGVQSLARPSCESYSYPVLAAVADLAEVKGQPGARRVLEIAAAGRHSLLFVGPPGCGKSMLISRLPGILPDLSQQQACELAMIRSLAGLSFDPAAFQRPPFQAPHHSASMVALVGGGSEPKPGAISLAHHGVLFLDELPEFDRKVLEALREPLEAGQIHIARAQRSCHFPASFQLAAAMNPCPCGYLGHSSGKCHCSSEQVSRYRAKISGPLLDRIDLLFEVPSLSAQELMQSSSAESSAVVKQRVEQARARQWQRQAGNNAQLAQTDLLPTLDPSCQQLLAQAMERLNLSARASHRLLRVARTIADLAGEARIAIEHLAEALSYRH